MINEHVRFDSRKGMTETIDILYIDDDAQLREYVCTIFKNSDLKYVVTEAKNEQEFYARFKEKDYDLVLSDFEIGEFDGFSVIDHVKSNNPDLPVVVITGSGSEEIAVECMKRGAEDYILKNYKQMKHLPHVIQSVLEKQRLKLQKIRKEDELRLTHEQLQAVMNADPGGILWVDSDLVVLGANQAFADIYKTEVKNLIGKRINALKINKSIKDYLELFFKQDADNGQTETEIQLNREKIYYLLIAQKYNNNRNAVLRCVDITARKTAELELLKYRRHLEELVHEKTARLIEANQHLVREIGERRQIEKDLQRLEKEKEVILDSLLENVVYQDLDNRIIWANKVACRSINLSREQVLGKRCYELWGNTGESCLGCPASATKKTRTPASGELQMWDGSWWFIQSCPVFNESDEMSGIVEVSLNITARKKADEERAIWQAHINQKQKLESIGTLASGVAHEINNPLNSILNYAQLIHNKTSEKRTKTYSDGIIEEGHRVSEIVKNLLSFARQEKESHRPENINDIIRATVNLLNSVLRKNKIKMQIESENKLPQVNCRKQQIQQVLINLLTNAKDALNEKYPNSNANKIIKIKVSVNNDSDKNWLRTSIEDSGTGIDSNIIDRIFDPFFTTKPRNVGTGLGLSVSYGIIHEHHGRLMVVSEPGKFTRFDVDLPVSDKK